MLAYRITSHAFSAFANLYQKNVNAIVIICRLNVKNISRTRSVFAENENNQMCMCDHKLHCYLCGMSLSFVASTTIKKNETNYKKFATGLQQNKKEKIKTMQSGNLLHSHQCSEHETNQLK